jgi:hypothetical protein
VNRPAASGVGQLVGDGPLGLHWLRLHDLRHGCATFLLAQCVDPRP